MRDTELLIPAGSLDVLKTAVIYGADAVYLGGEAFGLRAKAKNFTNEEIKEGIAFAHERGVKVYITANKNAIPNDPESPFVTSGMRIGTPAVTTRGFGAPEMLRIAEFIWQAATDFDNKANDIRRNVRDICANFPIY